MKIGLMQKRDERTMTVIVYDNADKPMFALPQETVCRVLKQFHDFQQAQKKNVPGQSVTPQV
jgi:hypothetical protein